MRETWKNMKKHTLYPVFRLLVGALLLGLALFVLSGCGDKEPEQRKAFNVFLDKNILSRKGVGLPELSRQERKIFGDYVAHYDVLAVFQTAMAKEAGKNARELLALAEFSDLASLAGAERSLRKAAKEAEGLRKSVTALKKKTDAAREKLSLPEDLAPAYNAAYDKIVTQPATASSSAFAAVNEAFAAILDLLDFVNANNRDMDIDGKNINLRNPGLKDALQTKLTTVNEKTLLLRTAYEDMTRAMLH